MQKVSFTLNKYINFDETTFISLKPQGKAKGTVLLSYIAEPFFLRRGQSIPNTHTQFWESVEMANVFQRLGYAVDVISYRSHTFEPQKKYTLFIGARTNFERIARLLNSDCIKIAHMDMSHWLYNNSSAITRCLELQQRRGITLKSYKLQEVNFAVENADYISILGNEFTAGTYAYAGKPIMYLPIPSCTTYPKPLDKDYEASKKNFLWLGSRGLVHKGLDLVIEAFLDLPDHHLTICGPMKSEKDPNFEKLFHKELYETANIHTEGWIDIESEEFKEISKNCIGMIYPSCAEGGGGCVITAMHAGMIPIVSYQASVDVDDSFGVMLTNNSVEEIKGEILNVSSKPNEELREMSHKAWQVARKRYTRRQ
ncbi:MAG: glycosyltransferase, partial [Balneolales bacterium]